MTQCIFECDIIMVVLKARENEKIKNVQNLKQTTELSKLKSIKMHALFWGLFDEKSSFKFLKYQ